MEITKQEAKWVMAGIRAMEAQSRSDEPDLTNSSSEFWAWRDKVAAFAKD
jgi:hypothetical protein